jgi:hypothetical protein
MHFLLIPVHLNPIDKTNFVTPSESLPSAMFISSAETTFDN